MSGADPVARARRLLARRGVWIEASGAGYVVRAGADRRARVVQRLDEAAFRGLAERPGLRLRAGGGWIACADDAPRLSPPAGRPGFIKGRRIVPRTDGGADLLYANLASSAVAWLARRSDAAGEPWLTRAEVTAAEMLGREAEKALKGPSLTLRWDALPRSSGSRGRAHGSLTDATMDAARRVEAALAACGPSRGVVEQICIHCTPLQAAEQALGLRRRTGKTALKRGLQALVRHYRLA